jgi:hypothetical protein
MIFAVQSTCHRVLADRPKLGANSADSTHARDQVHEPVRKAPMTAHLAGLSYQDPARIDGSPSRYFPWSSMATRLFILTSWSAIKCVKKLAREMGAKTKARGPDPVPSGQCRCSGRRFTAAIQTQLATWEEQVSCVVVAR